MGFINNAFKSFGKGSQSIGTWFGVSKDRTSGLAHFFGVPRGDDKQVAADAAAADAALNEQNAGVAAGRKRSRIGSALSTGAPDSGTAPTSSAIAYGKPTLGG